jgi:hypothetical protein
MSAEDHERERIIIESSILAVTLLFLIAALRGVTVDATAVAILSLVSAYFAIASIFATLDMFSSPGDEGTYRWCGLSSCSSSQA